MYSTVVFDLSTDYAGRCTALYNVRSRPCSPPRCTCSTAPLAGDCVGARLAVRDKRVRGVRGRLWLAGDATLLHTLRTLSSHTRVFRVHPWNWWSPAPLAPRSRTPLTIHSPSIHHPLTTPHVPLYARTYTAGTVKSQLRRRHRSEPGPAPRVGAPAHQGSGEEGGGRVRAETRC